MTRIWQNFDVLFAFIFIALSVIGFRLVGDDDVWNQVLGNKTEEISVGALIKKWGVVRYKQTESTLWLDVGRRTQPVSGGDTVFTGDDGSAEVRLDDGNTLIVEPNSLVVIEAPESQKATGWLAKIVRPLVTKTAKPSRFSVKSGTVKIRTKSLPAKISAAGHNYEILPKEKTQEIIITVDPKNEETPVKFNNADKTVAKEIVLTTNVVQPTLPMVVNTAPAAPKPVVATTPKPTPVRTVTPAKPTFAVKNIAVSTVIKGDAKPTTLPVKLVWKKTPDTKAYLVKIRDRAGNKIIEKRVEKPELIFPVTKASSRDYSYEVAAILKSGEKISSNKASIVIEFSSPVLRTPGNRASFTSDAPIKLSWGHTAFADQYWVQVAEDRNFSRITLDEKTDITAIESDFDPGTYYWRVKSLGDNIESNWSTERSFTSSKTYFLPP